MWIVRLALRRPYTFVVAALILLLLTPYLLLRTPTDIFPSINIEKSGTRKEELLYHPEEWERVKVLRKAMAALPPIEAMEMLIGNLQATKSNAELLLAGLR
jgi:hypothetical protein